MAFAEKFAKAFFCDYSANRCGKILNKNHFDIKFLINNCINLLVKLVIITE